MAWLVMQMSDPFGKLTRVRDGGRQEDVVHVVGQQNDRLLPHHAPLLVPHVVDLVKDDPAHLAHDLAAPVQHGPENLGGHDETRRARVDCDVARHQANIRKFLVKLSVFLVAQSLQ